MFNIIETPIEGVFIVDSTVFEDARGYFMETFRANEAKKLLTEDNFVQENESFSKAGTVRGIHFQRPPHAQSKLVRVVKGSVLDFAFDLRKDSPTYLQWTCALLSENNHCMFYIPKYCGHMFIALEDTIFSYKCTDYYDKESEGGIRWDDPMLNFKLPDDFAEDFDYEKLIISDRDKKHPLLTEETDLGF